MATNWPLSSKTLADAFSEAESAIKHARSVAVSRSAAMASGNVGSETIIRLYVDLGNDLAKMIAAGQQPGIVDYARSQKNNPTLDVVDAYNTVRDAVIAARTAINNGFPKDTVSGTFLLSHSLNGSGLVERQFTPAQTASVRTALDALAAVITP